MPLFTPDQLAAVGYQPPTEAQSVPSPGKFTPEQLAAVGYTPQVGSQPANDPSLLDKVGAGLQGAGAEINNLGGQAIHNVGTLVGSQGIKDFAQPNIDAGKDWMAQANAVSPTAASIGKFGVDAGALLAMPASTLPKLAASGALAQLAINESDTPIGQAAGLALGAAAGAATGAVVNAGVGMLSRLGSKAVAGPLANVIKGGQMAVVKDPAQFAQQALEETIKKSGGDLSKATPEQMVDAIIAHGDKLKTQASDMYKLRDSIADSAGIQVDRINIRELRDHLQADVLSGATEGTEQSLAAVKKILGQTDTATIPFAKAHSLLSDIGGQMQDAVMSGNGVLARKMGIVKDALAGDITRSSESVPELSVAHDAANDFYRDVVKPITNLQTARETANKVTQQQFVANLVNRIGKNAKETDAFTAMPAELKEQLVATHSMALKQAATKDGMLDLDKYSKILQQSLDPKKDATFYNLADAGTTQPVQPGHSTANIQFSDVLGDMHTLANVIGAKSLADKAAAVPGKSMGPLGVGAAVLTGGVSVPFMMAPMAKYLYSAGKMINNQSAQGLLKTMRGLSAYPESSMAKATASKIGLLYENQLKGKLSGKVASVFLPGSDKPNQ